MPLFEGCLGPYASFFKKQYQKVWKSDAPLDAILEGCLGRELNFRRKKVSKKCDAGHAWNLRDLGNRRRFPYKLNQFTIPQPADPSQQTPGQPGHTIPPATALRACISTRPPCLTGTVADFPIYDLYTWSTITIYDRTFGSMIRHNYKWHITTKYGPL